ncbi:chitinase [Clostridium cavendishii DSM 21758]|uniref:chitinase n=1 Tax=Clostridium cavendishii DSM 21758 TaxID=1121302 RepID=A0A1M6T3B1_9CLOT|nr:glycosyl hydrolase family 18 protein [Clostridium cavendishii]SHK51475.1 chitinase [Clostridium cavendishii DSM 21758]
MSKSKFFKKVVSVIAITSFMVTGLGLSSSKSAEAITTSGIPNHVLVGYWHNFSNGAGDIKLRDVSPNFDVINLSFGEPTTVTSGDIRFTPYNATDAEFKSDVQFLQGKGKKVLLSIGGEKGEVQLVDTASVTNFVNSVSTIIDKYGLDGLDVDFEGQSLHLNAGDKDFKNPTSPLIVNTISALKQLKAKYGDKFILTMAPETFFVQLGHTYYGGLNSYVDNRAGAFLPVIYALRDSLSWLQVQYYNSGPINDINGKSQSMGSGEFYASLVDMLLTGFNVNNDPNYFFPPLRQDQVVIGVPSCAGAGNGYVSNTELQSALDGLINGKRVGGYNVSNKYPNLRGLMTWSINWDKYTNFVWSNYFRNYFNGLTPPTNTLNAAQISSSAVINGNYSLSILIPAFNTATSYKIYEGTTVISSGNLTAGQPSQTLNYNITSKASGSYNYTVELSDGIKTITSNLITVIVPSPGTNVLQAAILSAGDVNNGAYTLTFVVPKNNTATSYKIYEGMTSISSGTLTAGQDQVTVKYDVNNKAKGSYDYTVVLSDSINSVISNKIIVTVPDTTTSNAWVPNHVYKTGDIVTYNGSTYKCLQGHTSLLGWEPSNVGALWEKQ